MEEEKQLSQTNDTDLQFDYQVLSPAPAARLKAENEELREQLYELRTELQDEKSHEKHLKREQLVDTKLLREEERKRAQSMVTEVRRKLYKEKQQEIGEFRDRFHKDKEKEIACVIRQKDEEIRKAKNNWNREKEELIEKLRVQFANEMREESQKSYEKQVVKLEKQIEELREQKKQVEESCRLVQEADKRKAEQIRRIHSEHEHELTKLKRSSWQEGRKQMAEIRQLTNIIHQLEKKHGVESGYYIQLQMEKERLRDKLDRVKGTDVSGRRSPLSVNSDLTSDLSFFSFPSMDNSNPLWLQLKQQNSTIAQLKQNLQDKNRRIDLLKQKLLKNRSRLGGGGILHRSMDDMLSYDNTNDSDDCISPQFGYSTGSSGASSVNDELIPCVENLEPEIIRKLRKELLTLEKAYSLLQAQTESSLDAKRNLMGREQLQTDLIDSQRKIDELNKELAESQDRNDLFEFQLQEALQGNNDVECSGSDFNIPILRVHYEFTDDELKCSAEEVKAKLEELENEKKHILSRDEQLALLQAKILIESNSKGPFEWPYKRENDPLLTSDGEDDFMEEDSLVFDKSRDMQRVSCDVSVQCQLLGFQYELFDHREELRIVHGERIFRELVTGIETAVQCDILKMKELDAGVMVEVIDSNSSSCLFRKAVKCGDSAVQTEFSDFDEKLVDDVAKEGLPLGLGVNDKWMLQGTLPKVQVDPGIEAAVQCDFIKMKGSGDDETVEVIDGNQNIRRFQKVVSSRDTSAQTSFSEFETEAAVQCDFMKMKGSGDDETVEVIDGNQNIRRFQKVVSSRDTSAQTSFSEFETEAAVQCDFMKMKGSGDDETVEVIDGNQNIPRFQKVVSSRDTSAQTSFSEFETEAAVQCDFMKMKGSGDDETVEVIDGNQNIRRFQKVVSSRDTSAQTSFSEFETEAAVQCDFMKMKGSGDDETVEVIDGNQNIRRFQKVISSRDASAQTSFSEFETEAAVQCDIMKIKPYNGDDAVEILDEDSNFWRFRKVLDCREIAVQSDIPDVVDYATFLPDLGVHDDMEVFRIDSGVQCNIMEITSFDDHDHIVEVLHETESWRFRRIAESRDLETQTDFVEFETLDYNVDGEDALEMEDGENVEEKHVGERSEKSLVYGEKNWKDFIVEKDLGEGGTRLDCIVYEKEDVLVVICETSGKHYKEVCKDPLKHEVGMQCSIPDEDQLQVNKSANHTDDPSTKHASPASSSRFYLNDIQDFKQSAFVPGGAGANVTQDIDEQDLCCSAAADLLNDLNCQRPSVELVGPPHLSFEKTTYGNHGYQSTTHDISTQCPDEGSPTTNTSCLYCGHVEVLAVDCGVQCEFADLCSASGITDLSGLMDISGFLNEETGDDSLIKEVVELAKECSQNDALIDQLVQSQEFYEEFKEDDEAIDVGVQCDILTTPKETQFAMDRSDVDAYAEVDTLCISESWCHFPRENKSYENPCDVSLQCSFLTWAEKTDWGTQWEPQKICIDCPVHVETGVLCDILVTVETCDKGVQYDVSENDDVEPVQLEEPDDAGDSDDSKDQLIYHDLYSEIPNCETREEIVLEADNISMNCLQDNPGNSKNSYNEITAGSKHEEIWKAHKDVVTQYDDFNDFPENVDKAVQCNLLHDGPDTLNLDKDAILHRDNSDEKAETSCHKPRPSSEVTEDEAVSENQRSNHGVCFVKKAKPEEIMFELTSLKLKNQQLVQQIVELKIQAKHERGDDSEVNEDGKKQRCDDSFGATSVSTLLPKYLGFEATVKPTRQDVPQEDDGLSKDKSIVHEAKINAEEAVVPKLNIDLDDVFREMDGKPTPPVLPVTQLMPQLDDSFQPLGEESAAFDVSDGLSRIDLESRPPAEEPPIRRTCAAGSSHVLDETLRGINEETLEANRSNNDETSSSSQHRSAVEGLDKIDCEETGKGNDESLVPQELNTQTEQEEALFSHCLAQSPSLSVDNHNLTEDISDDPLPSLPSCDPPPIPNSLPPSLSPSGFLEIELDGDIDALLAEDSTGIINPTGVRSTLDHEVHALLESEISSMSSEPDTVLSMDSLCISQVTRDPGPSGGSTSAQYHDAHDVFNDDTEMMMLFEHDDVISPTAEDSSVEALIDHVPSPTPVTRETIPNVQEKRHVAFYHQVSDSSSASADCDQRRKKTPPPVFPKPKYRSLSTNIPPSQLPRVPIVVQNKDNRPHPNSMAAKRDMVDGYFPPPGLVPKRANEFNSGEYDVLKERIVFLERQLKNKEYLLQSMRAEATEIETNAYVQKKEQDLKMMDENVRFLKLENQKRERELIAKIGELNKCNFELEQWKSERASSEKQRENMEETMDSQRAQLNHLQTVDVQFQELKCKYSTLECENTELQEKINRLHRADEEFIELEKVISDLQAKLKELEDVKRERDEFSEQLKATKTQKNDLVQKGRKVETERNDFLMNNKLMEQQKVNLEARNKVLQRTSDTFKTKLSSLEKECHDSQRKLYDVQRERDQGNSQLRKMEAERNELRKRVNELVECKSDLKQSQSKCHYFEQEVGYVHAQCKKLETERTELSSKLNDSLKERNRLIGRAAEFEQLSRGNEKLEEKFHTLKIKIAELTSQRDDAEVQLPTLKAKVALLRKACKEKDEQLEKMKEETRELKHSIATLAIDDLSNTQSFGFSSPEKSVKFEGGLNNDTTQATSAEKTSEKGEKYVVLFDYDPSRLSTTGRPEKELKLSEGDIVTVFGELDLSGYYMAELNGLKGLVSSLYVVEMDDYDVKRIAAKRREFQSDKSPPRKSTIPLSPPKTSTNIPELVKRSFVAIRDYNPMTSSTSGRPDLEISLSAGEVITVVGDVDANGYYTVEQRGRLAIIPSNLIKPSSPSLARPSKLSYSGSSQKTEQAPETLLKQSLMGYSAVNGLSHSSMVSKPMPTSEVSPTPVTYGLSEQVLQQGSVESILHTQNHYTSEESRGVNEKMLSPLQPSRSGLMQHGVRQNNVETLATQNYLTTVAGSSREMNGNKTLTIQPGLPAPPRNLCVLRCVNKDALLLGWIAPEIDEMGRNNGQLIKGYKILTNGQAKFDVDSPFMAKALVENLDLSRPIELAIQTVADNGFCSEKSLTHFNEAVLLETASVKAEEVSLDDGSPYKTYVALYSYDPIKNSPNPNPSFELDFQEGDIVRILDVSRPDGFYMAQIGSKQGLVPSNFIEEIAVAARPDHSKFKYSKEKDSHGSNTSIVSNTSSTGSRKGKVVVALYDYSPSTQSPNGLSGRELSFRKGQIIRIYGPMRSDGFYEADINGENGLVPSSFLKRSKRKSSKSAHSTSAYTSVPRRVQFVNQQGIRNASAGYV